MLVGAAGSVTGPVSEVRYTEYCTATFTVFKFRIRNQFPQR